jgi:chromosome segregation ATPase
MTNCTDLNQTLLSSLQSGDEQSSDDEIKTLNSSSTDNGDADIDTTLASPRYSSTNVQAVYNELLLIRTRLSQENERLKKKSDLLNQWEQRMRETIEHGWRSHKEKFDTELNTYKEKLNIMTKDFKRTNETLQLLREQNSELKRNVNDLRETNEKLVEKTKQAEKRAENLVRLNQNSEQKIKELEKNIEMNKKVTIINQNDECTKSTESVSTCRNTSPGDHCYEHHSSTTSRKFIVTQLNLFLLNLQTDT